MKGDLERGEGQVEKEMAKDRLSCWSVHNRETGRVISRLNQWLGKMYLV